MRYVADYAWLAGKIAQNVEISVINGRFAEISEMSGEGRAGRGERAERGAGQGERAERGAGWGERAERDAGQERRAEGGPGREQRGEEEDGRGRQAEGGARDRGAVVRLRGLTLPGLANAHSHAFHRVLRGRTQRDRGSFWTWRELMYRTAGSLTPDSCYRIARAVYGEMVLAGITCVGEFHYLHHAANGAPYDDPNAMGNALIRAAEDAGIRITLLDTLYLSSSVDGAPLEGVQHRFGDGDLDGWSARTGLLRPAGHARIGAAVHSVRAVPARFLGEFAKRTEGLPVHFHLSEQPAENDACRAAHGCSPTELLHRHGVLRAGALGVHATHLSDHDVALLAGSGAGACLCPTTERDLADGIGPARRLAEAGVPLSLGSDSHAVIDPFEELRGLELDERLATRRRGHFTPAELIAAATAHPALGWDDAGVIAVGARADLVTVSLDSVRTAGADPAQAVYAATAADVTDVLVDGRRVVERGRHVGFDVAGALREACA